MQVQRIRFKIRDPFPLPEISADVDLLVVVVVDWMASQMLVVVERGGILLSNDFKMLLTLARTIVPSDMLDRERVNWPACKTTPAGQTFSSLLGLVVALCLTFGF